MSLTLERGPPELYMEVQEVAAETTDESTETEEGGEST